MLTRFPHFLSQRPHYPQGFSTYPQAIEPLFYDLSSTVILIEPQNLREFSTFFTIGVKIISIFFISTFTSTTSYAKIGFVGKK